MKLITFNGILNGIFLVTLLRPLYLGYLAFTGKKLVSVMSEDIPNEEA
jgi:hypothetical protein